MKNIPDEKIRRKIKNKKALHREAIYQGQYMNNHSYINGPYLKTSQETRLNLCHSERSLQEGKKGCEAGNRQGFRSRKSSCRSGRAQAVARPIFLSFLFFIFISLLCFFPSPSFSGTSGLKVVVAADQLARLEQVLKTLEKFDHSQGEGPALELERLIFSLKDNPELKLQAEKRLLQFFTDDVSREARIAVSKPLSWIAGPEAARVLASRLLEPEKSDPARFVLERIPGEEADKALIEAVAKAPAEVLPGIISSLGHRRVEAAVPHLEKLLERNPQSQVVNNAIEALGNIGGEKATRILSSYLKSGDENLRLRAVDALLRIAGREVESGKKEKAASISDLLLKSKLNPDERLAAWRVKILAAGDVSKTQLQVALKSKDETARQAALLLMPGLVSEQEITSFLPLLAGGSEDFQVQVAAALSSFPAVPVKEFLMNQVAKSTSVRVRTEAIRSLGRAGDSSVVELLAQKAASSRGKEKSAARESLLALRGKSVDDKILELLAAGPEQSLRNELLLAACERNIREAREYFLNEAANPLADPALVSRGLRAFGDIGLVEELLRVAFKTGDEAFREELAGIMAAWARQSARPETRSAYFRNLLGKESDPARQALLIGIIGKIGERNSLPLIRSYINAQNATVKEAAIRALSDWPEVEARDDLMEIVKTSSGVKEKVLAIRGLVRLTASERYRKPEAVFESLKEIYALCPRAEEKKLVLSVFPDFPTRPALEFCQALVNDPEVGPEARAAAEKLKSRIKRT